MSTNGETEISELVRQPRRSEARELLGKVHSLVKPIIEKHRFRVVKLSEFFPKDKRLLGINVNRGSKISIRLRPHYDVNSFLPIESLVGTLLHELTHNVHGPHNAAFYKYLEGLEQEYYALLSSGYTGDGFYSQGHNLGSGGSNTLGIPLLHERRRIAADAATKRSLVYSGSGQKLGGRISKTQPLKELVAQSAIRRQQDAEKCGNHDDDDVRVIETVVISDDDA